MPTSRLGRLADLAYRRRGRMVLAWIAALVAVAMLAPLLADDAASDFSTPDSESARVEQLLATEFPGRTGDTLTVTWEAPDAAAQLPTIERLAREAGRLQGVGELQPPRYSRDGTIAVAQITLSEPGFSIPVETGEGLIALAEKASGKDLRIALGGAPVQEAGEGGGAPESFGLMAAALILLLAFGSIVAAGLPLAVALFGLGLSGSLIGVLAAVVDVPEFAPAVAALIGIGVGVDYALLILTRFRSALDHKDAREAVIEAVETAGRSVLIAGMTVLISVNGLFLMGVGYLRGVALAASLAVLAVMAAAVTLLPALLSSPAAASPPADPRPRPFAPHARRRLAALRRAASPGARARRRGRRAGRADRPDHELRLGFPDAGNDPAGSTTRVAYDTVARGFGPGANGPLLIAGDTATVRDADLARVPGVAFVSEPQVSRSGETALRMVTPRPRRSPRRRRRWWSGCARSRRDGRRHRCGAGRPERARRRPPAAVHRRRGGALLPAAAVRVPLAADRAEGGRDEPAVGRRGLRRDRAVASGGFFGGLIGVDTATPVAPFIPVMMFAILFGLSMDYEVFLLSRVREEYLRHGDTSGRSPKAWRRPRADHRRGGDHGRRLPRVRRPAARSS